jgi:hypothetical protein
MKYLILRHPGHQRTYFDAAPRTGLAELTLSAPYISVQCSKLQAEELEGIPFFSFETDSALTEKDLEIISGLSFCQAVFESGHMEGKQILIPLGKPVHAYLDPVISSLLKYQGKTSERFTRLMINVALRAGKYGDSERLRLLDPMAGKGTTLFEAAAAGYDAVGIEIAPKPVHEVRGFFKKFLESGRLVHKSSERMVHSKGKKEHVGIREFTYARTRDEFADPDARHYLGIINGDARDAHLYFKQAQFHMLVADLPYGIFHGSKAGKKSAAAPSRNPAPLLEECLQGWQRVMLSGAAMVLAWNTLLVSRSELSALCEKHGFELRSEPPYGDFAHRVDQSIRRDILVAVKP